MCTCCCSRCTLQGIFQHVISSHLKIETLQKAVWNDAQTNPSWKTALSGKTISPQWHFPYKLNLSGKTTCLERPHLLDIKVVVTDSFHFRLEWYPEFTGSQPRTLGRDNEGIMVLANQIMRRESHNCTHSGCERWKQSGVKLIIKLHANIDDKVWGKIIHEITPLTSLMLVTTGTEINNLYWTLTSLSK